MQMWQWQWQRIIKVQRYIIFSRKFSVIKIRLIGIFCSLCVFLIRIWNHFTILRNDFSVLRNDLKNHANFVEHRQLICNRLIGVWCRNCHKIFIHGYNNPYFGRLAWQTRNRNKKWHREKNIMKRTNSNNNNEK